MFLCLSARKFAVALTFASAILFVTSAHGQTPAQARPADLETEVSAVKAENAAVREQLKTMEEQQKALTETVDRLQRELGGVTPAGGATQPGPAGTQKAERYQDGIVIWQTPETEKVPFLVKYNQDIQLRYLNTLSSEDTYTDHLGVVRDVHKRNDITVNRTMLVLGGYIFSKRLVYNFKVWSSAGAASIVVAGNVGWSFSRHSR